MNISIFGLGYVGAVSAGCLASAGHRVIGVETNRTKVDIINAGQAPIVEAGLGDMIRQCVSSGLLRATTNAVEAIHNSDLSIVCVGTPSDAAGRLDLHHVRNVCEEVGRALATRNEFHVVVLRSTILPGSMREVVIPTLELSSGKTAGVDFGVCNNPEFLREGTAIHDFLNPPKTVIGETDTRSGDLLAKLYEDLSAPFVRTSIEVAEMVKYADNVWHALKVGFANEIGALCKVMQIDSHQVMEIFCQDTKLNLSSYYLKPGFAFGGSCLPKDVRALSQRALSLDVNLPIVNSILPSNELQMLRAVELVLREGRKRVGLVGLSFKSGTDDLRESPTVAMVERLLGKGSDLRIFDRNVQLAALTGANRDYLYNHIPHIYRLLVPDVETLLAHAEVLVVAHREPSLEAAMGDMGPEVVIIDLARLPAPLIEGRNYHGICW